MPVKPTSHENLLRLTLMIAACFAIGSIALLTATLLQHYTVAVPTQAGNSPSAADAQKKQAIILSLMPAANPSYDATSTDAAAPDASSKQAATEALKVRILQSLNGK